MAKLNNFNYVEVNSKAIEIALQIVAVDHSRVNGIQKYYKDFLKPMSLF